MTAPIPEDVLAAVVTYVSSHVRAPIGVEQEDLLQDARAIAVRRWNDGFREGRLFKRVWGDLKDQYGTAWVRHYSKAKANAQDAPGRAIYHPDDSEATSVRLDVAAAILKLTPAQQFVVRGIMAGQSQEEIAQERGCTAHAIKKVYKRARECLAELLKEYANE